MPENEGCDVKVPEESRGGELCMSLLVLVGLSFFEVYLVYAVYLGMCQCERCVDRESVGMTIGFLGTVVMVLPMFPLTIRNILIRDPAKRRRYARAYIAGLVVAWSGFVLALFGFILANS